MKILHCINPSTTLLAIAGVYTSTWQRVSSWPLGAAGIPMAYNEATRIRGFVDTDVASAALGFRIEYSLDGATVHSFAANAVAAGVPLNFDVMLFGSWMRIQYTNGAAAQARFNLIAHLVEFVS